TKQRDEWLAGLKEKCFGGWPEKAGPLELKQVFSAEHRGVDLDAYEFTSQPNVRLRLYLARRPRLKKPERVVLAVQNEEEWDIRRVTQAFRSFRSLQAVPLWLEAHGELAADALYASLFEKGIAGLELWQVPKSHRDGPDYLNVLRVLDLPQAAAMAAERSQV